MVQPKHGEKFVVILKDVKFVPELWVNLFSISKALKNGFNLGNEDVVMKLMKGNTTLYFDRMLKTKNGFVSGIKLLPILGNNIATTAVEENKVKPKININNLHKILGHCGEVATRMTGKSFGYDVTGDYKTCEACSVAKARQKNINKDWKGGSITPGERLYVDISSIKGESYGGSKFWALVVDDYSGYCWSYFLNHKNDIKNKLINLVDDLKDLQKTVKFLRLDDAGENFALEKACKQRQLGLQFEFTGPRTPQRNGKVKRKFQTLYGRIRAMFNDSGIADELRHGLWAECASTASFYENRIVNKTTQQSPLQLMYNKQFKGSKNLKTFGEICVVTTKKAIQGKLNDRGTVGLFVGYPDNHSADVYRIFNIKTKQIIKSRDLIWLNLSYGNWKSKINIQQPPDDDDTSDTETTDEDTTALTETEDATLDEAQIRKQNKALKEISRLKSWFNPDPSKFLEMQNSGREMIVETADFAFNTVDLVKDPESFDEAYNHPETDKKIMWRRAISKEFEEMKAKGVWEKIQKSEIPNGQNSVKNHAASCMWLQSNSRCGFLGELLSCCK